MANSKDIQLDTSIGTLQVLPILTKDEWEQKTILSRCDVVKKDNEIKNYPTQKIAGVQYYNKTETKALNKLQKEWKKAGGMDLVYENYVANTQAANAAAQTQNADNWIEFNKGKIDVQNRTLYVVGGAILLILIVLIKN